MKFSFAHNNINVKDLDKSLAFYKEALLLEESRRLEDPSGAFTLVYLKSPYTAHELELTWLTMKRLLKSIKKWALLLMKMLIWAFIS